MQVSDRKQSRCILPSSNFLPCSYLMAIFHTALLAAWHLPERALALHLPDEVWSPDSCTRLWGGSTFLINVTLHCYKMHNSSNGKTTREYQCNTLSANQQGKGGSNGAILLWNAARRNRKGELQRKMKLKHTMDFPFQPAEGVQQSSCSWVTF